MTFNRILSPYYVKSTTSFIVQTVRHRSIMAANRRVIVRKIESEERIQMTLSFESE